MRFSASKIKLIIIPDYAEQFRAMPKLTIDWSFELDPEEESEFGLPIVFKLVKHIIC